VIKYVQKYFIKCFWYLILETKIIVFFSKLNETTVFEIVFKGLNLPMIIKVI